MRTASLLLSCFCAFVTTGLASDWRYDSNEDHGDEGWSGICSSGKKQSPIDLPEASSAQKNKENVEPLIFFNYQKAMTANLTNNGHTVVLKIDQPCDMAIAAGGLRNMYVLDQIHFHWKSEHTIKEKRFAMEMHLVHHKLEAGSFEASVNQSKGLAVLGIFLEEREESNPVLDDVIEGLAQARREGDMTVLGKAFSTGKWLPHDRSEFYRYEGSLTTPPCFESVLWTVFRFPIHISREQVDRFREIQAKDGPLKYNYRPTQPYNNREVKLISTKELTTSAASTSFHSSLSILFLSVMQMVFKMYF